MSMMRFAVLGSLVASLAASGCLHSRTEMPGVLDLRSTGSDAPLAQEPIDKAATRAGFDAFSYGAGVEGSTDVTIDNRTHYLIGLVPVLGDSAAEEWRLATGGGALRNVTVSDSLGGGPILLTFLKNIFPCSCVTGWVAPTWGTGGRAIRIAASAARDIPVTPAGAQPPPPDASPPNAPSPAALPSAGSQAPLPSGTSSKADPAEAAEKSSEAHSPTPALSSPSGLSQRF